MSIYTFLLQVTDKANNANLLNDWSKSLSTLGQFFYYLFCFVLIIFLAYYLPRKLNNSKLIRKSSNIKIIESVSVGYQASICLVNIGDKYMLIGVAKDKITFLTDVELDSPPVSTIDNKIPFENVFNQYLRNKTEKKNLFKKNEDDDSDNVT